MTDASFISSHSPLSYVHWARARPDVGCPPLTLRLLTSVSGECLPGYSLSRPTLACTICEAGTRSNGSEAGCIRVFADLCSLAFAANVTLCFAAGFCQMMSSLSSLTCVVLLLRHSATRGSTAPRPAAPLARGATLATLRLRLARRRVSAACRVASRRARGKADAVSLLSCFLDALCAQVAVALLREIVAPRSAESHAVVRPNFTEECSVGRYTPGGRDECDACEPPRYDFPFVFKLVRVGLLRLLLICRLHRMRLGACHWLPCVKVRFDILVAPTLKTTVRSEPW